LVLTDEHEFARYPFTLESARYIESKGIDLSQLDDPSYAHIIEQALRRVEEAIMEGEVHTDWSMHEDEVETLSYPVAVAMVAAIGDPYLRRRYALAEAKRVNKLLDRELAPELSSISRDRMLQIGRGTFNWDLLPLTVEGMPYSFALALSDYLRNSGTLSGDRWKLVNRKLVGGSVYLSKRDVARLLQEEVRKRIEKRLEDGPKIQLPESLLKAVEKALTLLLKIRGDMAKVEPEETEVHPEAFPPCVKDLINMMKTKQHLPHVGRFTFATFLLIVGCTVDDLMEFFKGSTDFDEAKARYQIEHLAGEKGSKRRYLPPNCQMLRTYGICRPTDPLCKSVKHPLTFYKRKRRTSK